MWLFDFWTAGGPAARLDHRLNRRRSDLCRAAHLFAEQAPGPDARRQRRVSTIPSRCCWCSASSSGSSSPTTGCWTCSGCSSPAGHRRRGRRGGGLARGSGVQARAARHAGALPGGLAGRRRGVLRRRGEHRGVRLPRRLPRRPCTRQREHPGQADHHELPRGPRLGRAARRCSSRSACSSSRASWPTSPSRARCWPSSSRSWPGRSRRSSPPRSTASASRSAWCWAGRGCAERCRSCSPCSR